MKTKLLAAIVNTGLLAAASPLVAADITMPDPNYATATAVMNVIRTATEQELGLEVSTVTTSAATVIWEAMGRNKGEVDVWPDTWLPNQKGLVDKYVKELGSVKLAANNYEAEQGYCTTELTYNQYNIKNVADLANPDNAKLFDRDDNGKGNIWIGAPGWQSTNVEKVRARDYGFLDFFDLETTDEAISNAALDRAVNDKKPWVGYCYKPHQNFARYKLKFLAEPAYDASKVVVIQPNEDPQWYEKSRNASAYDKTTVHIAYASSLADRQPDLVAALERMSFDPDEISNWAYQIIVEKKSAEDVAKAWVDAHGDVVGKWFGR